MNVSATIFALINLALFSGLAHAETVPEPGALPLLAIGAIAAGAMWLKKRNK